MTQTIAIGDRVLFTNPSTGQQLVGTVESYHADKPRPWRVKFDSHMFPDTRDTTYLVSDTDCVVL
jgi:ribosomal protein L35AE/L33A